APWFGRSAAGRSEDRRRRLRQDGNDRHRFCVTTTIEPETRLMAFERICALADVWEGEMQVFEIDGKDVLIINGEGGIVRAVDARCPHQDHPLAEGSLEGRTLTCNAHLWQFDIESGAG